MSTVSFPRRVLLAVTGLSPQIVTETLYALAHREPAETPTEVQVITTGEGAERVRLALLSNEPGWFHRLCRDFDLHGIHFGPECIHVLRDPAGNPLPDIRTPEDNERAADFITDRIRELTADETTAVHVSIAGGRKTMGFYAGYALSLYGRPQDRLSHVLVSEPFESSWEFFYPTPYSRVITTRDNKLVDTAEARVTLASIPFVSLREGLPKRLTDGTARFSDVVHSARRALQSPELTIDLAGRRILASGERVEMDPVDLAFYAMFARLRASGAEALKRHDPNLANPFLDEYRRIAGEMSGDLERTREALRHGMDVDYFDQRKSRVQKVLDKFLGPQLAALYQIHPQGSRQGKFSLQIPAEAIQFDRIPDEVA